ncbi:MAG: class I SAM-dependent methyltransferase [Alphaproteobacteria bacterium]|nr:class I SAM-dependent methyltransferase [Alphaproteobacteria bacterium]
MQDSATFWDKAADKYAKSPIADEAAYAYTLERTRTYLSAGDNILEVGCGTGSTALLLAGDVGRITASDISSNMISIATEKAKSEGIQNVTFVTAALSDDTLDNGPYDAVLAHNLIHLLDDVPAALRGIHGLLKSDGVFISKTVCLPKSGAPFKFRLLKAIVPLMQWVGKAPYVNFMDTSELESLVTKAGFKIVETGTYPPPSRYIVARKI